MMRELNDARHALGIGVVFVGYAAFLFVDRWLKNRRLSDETRARLILDDAAKNRSRLLHAEGIE